MNIKPKSMVGVFVMLTAPFLVGCPKAPSSYKLQRSGTTTILIPPNVHSTNEKSPQFIANLKNARRRSVAGTNCDIEGHIINLHWHGKAAEIRVNSDSYIAERGMYLDPLQDIGKFHEELLQRESKGCFSSTDARQIRRAVAERFPLPPSIAYRYELGSYDTTGFFELTSDFRLNVVSPIYHSVLAQESPRKDHTKTVWTSGPAMICNDLHLGWSRMRMDLPRHTRLWPVSRVSILRDSRISFPSDFANREL